jgi:RNA polymerase sigma-70 factor (ECF subfamily)
VVTEDLYIRNLLTRIADSDDKTAFTGLFNRYYNRLVQFAMLFVSSHSLAEDVVSEVLIRLLRKRKELASIENFQGYLFQSVKNEALNQLKLQKKEQLFKPIDYEEDIFLPDLADPHEWMVEKELREIVTAIVEKLPPKRRMVYKMIKDEGMRYKDVSALLEISERTVEVHLKIAIGELREAVTKHFLEKQSSKEISYLKVI